MSLSKETATICDRIDYSEMPSEIKDVIRELSSEVERLDSCNRNLLDAKSKDSVVLDIIQQKAAAKRDRVTNPFRCIFDDKIEEVVNNGLISRNDARVFLDITSFIEFNTGVLVDKDKQFLTQSSLAEKMDISLRQMARIISKLCAAKMILKKKSGFRTVYMVNPNFAWRGKMSFNDMNTAISGFS